MNFMSEFSSGRSEMPYEKGIKNKVMSAMRVHITVFTSAAPRKDAERMS